MDHGLSSFLHAPFQLCNNSDFTKPTPSSSSSSSPLSPFHYGSLNNSSSSSTAGAGLPSLDFQLEDPFMPPHFDPLYASLSIVDHHCPENLLVCGRSSSESGTIGAGISIGSPLLWSDTIAAAGFETGVALCQHQMHQPPVQNDGVLMNEVTRCSGPRARRTSRNKRGRKMRGYDDSASEGNNSVAEFLTWEIISQYFYMPIAQAAGELNIGLTLFKKRCRELGVRRWPHRKLMSIDSLIKNVQEMEEEGGVNPAVSKSTIQGAIQVLEKQRKMMEVMPDFQLEDQTKRLRQACFKANYKKRRLMIMNNDALANSPCSAASSSKCHESTAPASVNNGSSSSVSRRVDEAAGYDFEEGDELKSLLFDALSPSECTLLSDYA